MHLLAFRHTARQCLPLRSRGAVYESTVAAKGQTGDTDKVGHLFRSDVGRGFRFEGGQRSEMKSDAMAPCVGSGLRVIAVSFAVKRRFSGGLVF